LQRDCVLALSRGGRYTLEKHRAGLRLLQYQPSATDEVTGCAAAEAFE
jgi:hypothetical protein